MRVPEQPYERERDVAIAAARAAGEVLRAAVGNIREVSFKSEVDLVTEVDRASEALISERLLSAFPDDRLLAEEGTGAGENAGAERLWIVDPLDGTTNFTHGYPMFCVSIALRVGDETQVGVVYDPMRDELFVAVRGQGATLQGQPIRVSSTNSLIRAMLCTGFAYDLKWRGENLAYWARFIDLSQAVRRDGAAALDVAYVACGRYDGYWERGVSAWDIAAAALMLEEAGGRLSGYTGQAFDPFAREIVATNDILHQPMLDVIADVSARQPARLSGRVDFE